MLRLHSTPEKWKCETKHHHFEETCDSEVRTRKTNELKAQYDRSEFQSSCPFSDSQKIRNECLLNQSWLALTQMVE